jgi:hypothetical protein
MAGRRRHKRIVKRLETQFFSGDLSFRGTSSNLSASGLFLRTIKPFPPDTQVGISIQLPDNTVATLKGMVRWSLKAAHRSGRSGMGIEISEYDRHYVDFLNSFLPPQEQILRKEQKKSVPEKSVLAPPAPKIEQTVHRDSIPAPRCERTPPARPKGPPKATRQSDNEIEDTEIDSLFSSLFSRNAKKEAE